MRAPVSAAPELLFEGRYRRPVPVLLHGKVFAYYGGTVGIGVDVDDETDWGRSQPATGRHRCATSQPRERHPRCASLTARWRETATERSR